MCARATGDPLSEEEINQIIPLLLAAGQITPDERDAVRRDAEVGLSGTRYAAMIAAAKRTLRYRRGTVAFADWEKDDAEPSRLSRQE